MSTETTPLPAALTIAGPQIEMHPQRWGSPDRVTDLPDAARGLIELAFGLDERPASTSVELPAVALPSVLVEGL
ncbi:MAG: hypothetical protein F2667_14145, partial [Actinobacteria bacterium]|nr:hypothetical protein [Actinomycetota bacterium]